MNVADDTDNGSPLVIAKSQALANWVGVAPKPWD
jgi:hypothetical protein